MIGTSQNPEILLNKEWRTWRFPIQIRLTHIHNPSVTWNIVPNSTCLNHVPRNNTTFYQQIIGITRWVIELEQIDMSTEVSLMFRYLSQSRIRYLIQFLHTFSYLKINQCIDFTYDPTKINVNESTFLPQDRAQHKAQNMKILYPDATDHIPPNMPWSLGKILQVNAFVAVDLTGEQATRRSQTGILIYYNMVPIIWSSRRKNTVQVSTFGAESIAMHTMIDILLVLRYKLRIFSILIDGPCNMFCDNEAATKSSINPHDTLKKNKSQLHSIKRERPLMV